MEDAIYNRNDRLVLVGLIAGFGVLVAVTMAMIWPYKIGCPAPTLDCRAAAAAEHLNLETAFGIFISGLGTLALLTTIYYSHKATNAAIDAVQIANKATQHSIVSTNAQLRPYFKMESSKHKWIYNLEDKQKAHHWKFGLKWENFGETPATNVSAMTQHHICKGELPEGFDFPTRPGNDFVGTIGSEDSFESWTLAISVEDLRPVLSDDLTLHIYGWVEYDGFGVSKRSRSEYHAVIEIDSVSDCSDVNMQSTNYFRKSFNGMDDDCFRRLEGVKLSN
jgi:hypothetical protein